MADLVLDLLDYIRASPTPYHVVAESVRRLTAAGFTPLRGEDEWSLGPGDRRWVSRHDGSLVAFEIGTESPTTGGFRVVGAHTDSPNLRLKPLPETTSHGCVQLGVEPYGGLLLHTWLDRDLSVAGRVLWLEDGSMRSALIDFARPLLRIPNLAIHLQREVREEGVKLNPQLHAAPLLGLSEGTHFSDLLAAELRAASGTDIAPPQVLSSDLMLYDTQPPALGGAERELILAPRLDNQASCHAGLVALLRAPAELPRCTRVLVLYDHEEVGSRSARGAAGPLLAEVLARIVAAVKGGAPQGIERALAGSLMISADMAHAVHPNYADRHEPGHRPRLGRGPVLKTNAGQAYATDADSGALFTALCRDAGIEPQHFVVRSDMACGSTIGPITAARLGIRTVDAGNPMLSMHSCREMAGAADVAPMIEVLARFYAGLHAP